MANQSISQRPAASTLKDDDLLLVSQKQPDGSYLTCRVTADKLKGASAYQIWQVHETTNVEYLTQNTVQNIINESNQTQQTFINNTNLQPVYNNWQQVQIDNSKVTEVDYLERNTLNAIYQISNKTENEFLSLVNLTTSYESWTVEEYLYFIQFLKETNRYTAYINSGGTNDFSDLENYINNNVWWDEYNTWYDNTDGNWSIIYFLNEYRGIAGFDGWKQTHPGGTVQQFLTAVNNLTAYNTWKQDKLDTVNLTVNRFLQVTNAISAYTSWLTTHVGSNIDDFLVQFSLQDNFNSWVEDRLEELTEPAFMESLKGKDGKDGSNGSSGASASNDFWIVANVNDPEQNVEFAALLLPHSITIDPNDGHVGMVSFPVPQPM